MGGLCGGTKSIKPDYMDPLGPRQDGSMGPSGGPEARDQIFSTLQNSLYPNAQRSADYASGVTRSAVSNPGWGGMQQYLNGVIGGNRLSGSPFLDRANATARTALDTSIGANQQAAMRRLGDTRSNAQTNLAGTQATQRSAYTRSGQRFGTGNQQTQEATQAALQAQLARGENTATSDLTGQANVAKSGLAAQLAQQGQQNYQAERQAQTQAAALMPQSISGQAQLAQTMPGVEYSAVAPAAQIIQGLAGGGSQTPGQVMKTPGALDYIGQVAGIAGMAGY